MIRRYTEIVRHTAEAKRFIIIKQAVLRHVLPGMNSRLRPVIARQNELRRVFSGLSQVSSSCDSS